MKKQERIISISSSIPISSTFFYSCCLLRKEEGSSSPFSFFRLLSFIFPYSKREVREVRERDLEQKREKAPVSWFVLVQPTKD